MPEPKNAQNGPYVKDMEPGTYYWCSCGHSKNQPFCDGAHQKAGEFSPVELIIEEKGDKYFCGCKQTKNPPYCDGAHKSL
ncbi:MAG: hypothetical protein IEMM0002_0162 [bacterium]|nr:MAG: hypothetical protein IEMM0002_0162 [bacterium]